MPRMMIIAGMLFVSSFGNLGFAAPYSSQELTAVETSKESQIRELRNEEINQIRIALGRRNPKNRIADLYFRLAELYMEAYRADFLREGRVHEKRLTQGIKDAHIDHGLSNVSVRYGIKAAEELLRLGIPFAKLDHVYYFLGYNHKELGQTKKSQEFFKKLVDRFPSSPFVYEALKEMGDSAFENSRFRQALPLYQRALSLPVRGETEARIKYRLAWTYYRLKQFSRAIEEMKSAISMASKNGDKFISLKEEALRDMALFMTETGNVKEAITYFQSVLNDPTYYPKVLEHLGREYERNAKIDKATEVYQAVLQTHPESESAIRIINKLMDVDQRRGKYALALTRLKILNSTRALTDDAETAYSNLKAFVRKTATENHELFRKKHKKENLTVAHDYYAAYLDFFLKKDDPRKEMNEIKMYLADTKRELGQSVLASDLYKQIIQSKDSKYSKQAADLWVGSLTEAMKGMKDRKKSDLSSLEKDFIAAVDFLNENSSETETAKEASLRAAQLMAAYPSHQEEAIDRIEKIIESYPASKQAVTAAKLRLQLASDKKDVKGVANLISDYRENEKLMGFDRAQKGILTSAMSQYGEQIRVTAIEAIEKDKDFAKAAAEYEKFAGETQDAKQSEKALANALVYYEKALDWDSVSRIAKRQKNKTALKRVAFQYFIHGQEAKSVQAFKDAGEEKAAAKVAAAAAGKTWSDGPSTAEKSIAASRAKLDHLKQKWNAKHYPPVSLPDAQLKKAVQERVKAIEAIAREAKPLIEGGGPVSLSALEYSSDQIIKAADEIEHADVSKAGTPQAKENYKKSLSKVSAPLREKAKGLKKKAYEKASEARVYSSDILGLAEEWARDRSQVWARIQAPRPRFRVLGIAPNGGSEGADAALKRIRTRLSSNPADAASWTDLGNLLWGNGKSHMAKVAYQQSLEIQSKNAAALNNIAAMELSNDQVEDPVQAQKADALFKEAVAAEGKSWTIKWNWAQLQNYYRLYRSARSLIESIRTQAHADEVEQAYAIALAALGQVGEAKQAIERSKKADSTGASNFAVKMLEAATHSGEDCLDALDDLKGPEYKGFESRSVSMLRKVCESEKK